MSFLLDGFRAVTWQQGVMYLVGFALIYLAIQKDYEPALLLPMGFGAILVNLPSSGVLNQMVEGIGESQGIIQWLFETTIEASEAHEVHHALLPRHGSKAVKQKFHRLTSLCPPADVGGNEHGVEKVDEHTADQRSGDTISVEQSHLVGDDPAHPEQESA